MSDRTDAPGHLPPGPGEDHAGPPRLGQELFTGRTWDGDEVTLVCFDDGYRLRRNGADLPGRRWAAGEVDEALAAYRAHANPSVRLVFRPPAA